MAKVKIQGHASGTGILTVTAPNTSTDRTITLPDSSGTLATTADNGSQLDYSGSKKIEAVSTGAAVTGNLTTTGNISTGNNGMVFILDSAGQTSGRIVTDSSAANALEIGADPNNQAADSYTAFRVDNTERMRITPDGLTFNGDTAAANALDDYEEGTFTTTANAGSGTITLVSNQDLGAYVKIGSLVHWSLHIGVSSTSSASGDLYFTLPFTLGNFGETAGEGSFACWVWAATTGDSGTWVGWVERGSNRAYLRRGIGTQPGTSANLMTGGTEIRMSGTFRTA